MSARIIDGNKIAGEVYLQVEEDIRRLKDQGVTPGLGVILVGNNPASLSYVKSKEKKCAGVGIYERTVCLPADASEAEILRTVDECNRDTNIHGVLVQLPLPRHISPERVIERISPEKDVDGLHPANMGRLLKGTPYLLPCTAHGIQRILLSAGYDTMGKHVVICGRSNIVGRPLAALLLGKGRGANATVTVCHTGTENMAYFTRQADILVVAMGKPHAITADMVKEGAAVIDVGINRVEDVSVPGGYRLVGDVDFQAVSEKAAAITPVPGGVGPMTVAMLMYNTVEAAKLQVGKN
jgi:methylenetetrahydrofolate dehydrogenase (NADP+)/methenyltetrahydrofolate cyclohydrolase